MNAHRSPQPRRAPPHRRVRARLLLSCCFLTLLHSVRSASQALRAWLPATTVVPQWLPAGFRHPWMGYLLALCIEGGAASLTFLLVTRVPAFDMQGVLLLVGIVLVALTSGVGPSVLATGVGLLLLESVILPPSVSSRQSPANWVDLVVLLVSGLGLGLLAGQTGWARQRAEALAGVLTEAHASSDLERLRLRALVEALPAPVAMVDTQERLVEANPAVRTFWGEAAPFFREMAEFARVKGWWTASGQPVDKNAWAIARALHTGERVTNEEVEIETFDGQRKIVLDPATPIRDERGTIHGAVGIFQDITERKRLEAALREAEREAAARARELEAIFEALTDGLVVYDAQGRILRSNTAARQLFGFEAQPEFAALSLQERFSRYAPRDAEGQPVAPEDFVPARLLSGEVLISAQAADQRLQTPDGREVFFSITGRFLRDAEGEMIGAVGIARDVTEQRRLEQQNRAALEALLAMAEALVQVPDWSLAAVKGSAAEANPVARRLAELTRRVLGFEHVSMAAVAPGTGTLTPITVVNRTPEHERDWWAGWDQQHFLGDALPPSGGAALQAGEPVLLEYRDWSVWGSQDRSPGRASLLVPMQVGQTLVGLLRLERGTQAEASQGQNRLPLIKAVARLGALVLERERLLLEREEARANELALREANTQMDTFLGIASHELKTPLTSLKLSLQVAERRMRRLVQRETAVVNELAPYLDQLAHEQRQAERLERLVNELLDASRVRAGKLELHPEPADLVAIVGEAVEEQREIHPERTLAFQFAPPRTVPVVADADRLGQVVTNYLTNALKYSPADRPVTVGLDVEEGQARVWVRDQGPGLPPEEQERIWERFHRVKGIEVQSGTGVGLGLGLHICREIVERHQGQVGVQSTPGQGSTFWFTLPLGSEPDEQGPAPG